jgi:hypothetical protein
MDRNILPTLGYKLREGWDDYIQTNYELWYKFIPDDTRFSYYAFYAEKKHKNSAGIVHGGVLATYLDHCMGGACYNVSGGKFAYTLQYNIQFISAARPNRWIFAKVEHLAGFNKNLQMIATAHLGSEDGPLIAQAIGTFELSDKMAKKKID